MFTILGLAILVAVIFIHEMGHLVAAKLLGLPVESFNVGMGPKLFSFKRKETEWALRLLPLGGFIRMDQMALKAASPWKKIVIFAAGPAINLIPFIILVSILGGFFQTILVLSTLYWETISATVETLARSIDFFHWFPNDKDDQISSVLAVGPVTHQMYTASGLGATVFMLFFILNVSLGLFNLIPIPPLDGGRIVVGLSEMVFSKTVAKHIEAILTLTGTIIVLWLIILVMYHDIVKLF